MYTPLIIEVIFGLNKPLPATKHPIPKYKPQGVSIAIEAWPKVIIKAPNATAFLYPINLSAIRPPNIGEK